MLLVDAFIPGKSVSYDKVRSPLDAEWIPFRNSAPEMASPRHVYNGFQQSKGRDGYGRGQIPAGRDRRKR